MENQKLLEQKELLFKELNKLRHKNGFFSASDGDFYKQFSWWRDNFYACLPYLKNYPDKYIESYHNYLDQLHFFEDKYGKFTWMINKPNTETCRYLHARIRISTMDEIHEQAWGNKQNDAVAMILIGISLGEEEGLSIIRNDKDRELIQLITDYLISVDPTINPSNDIWEEEEGCRSSTIGLCKLAFIKMKSLGFKVDGAEIDKCDEFLENTLPFETDYRTVDLALLTLPLLGVVDKIQSHHIVRNVEKHLLRNHGVIRYKGDRYYNNSKREEDIRGHEPAWTFGFAYLSSIYEDLGNTEIADMYLEKLLNTWSDGRIPELVYAGTDIPNDNRVLAWSNALTICAIDKVLSRNK